LSEATVQAILNDPETAPIRGELKATLRFLRKLVLAPDTVTAADAAQARAAGVSDDALREAMYVLYLFSIYTRLADTLGWALMSKGQYRRVGQMLLRMGYDM